MVIEAGATEAGAAGALRVVAHGVTLAVRLTPKAAADRIEGVVAEAGGAVRLKVAVTKPPEDGKANAALIAFLAKKLKLPKSGIRLIGGDTSRQKLLLVEGDGAALITELAARLSAFGLRP